MGVSLRGGLVERDRRAPNVRARRLDEAPGAHQRIGEPR